MGFGSMLSPEELEKVDKAMAIIFHFKEKIPIDVLKVIRDIINGEIYRRE